VAVVAEQKVEGFRLKVEGYKDYTMNTPHTEQSPPLTLRDIVRIWWPLAASWALMTLEGPAQSAIVARLANAEVNLAAWGGIVSSFSFFIASPVIMMMSAATALASDYPTYRKLRRFTMRIGLTLTLMHILVAFTPLYDFVARNIIGAPEAIIEPGRIGMRIVVPWAWAIGFRRFNQGVMIRYGHSKAVGLGTAIRLGSNIIVLLIGYTIGTIPGIIVACTAVATGVVAEAIYSGLRARPIVREQIIPAPVGEPLSSREFLAFYIPLALTSLIWVIIQPFGSAAISRMPNPLTSLAAWPVVNGLLFLLRSPGMALNEVVVAQLGRPGAVKALRRFSSIIVIGSTVAAVLIIATPLADIWLRDVMAISAELLPISKQALWLGLGLPAMSALISWYNGQLVHQRRTRGVTEATTIYSLTMIALLWTGILVQRFAGLPVAVVAYEAASLGQVAWLWNRSRRSKIRG
jgi:hypothetical protein